MFGDKCRTKKYDECACLHPKNQKDPHTTPEPLSLIFKTKKKEKVYIHLDSGYCPLRKPRSGAWVRPAVIIYQQYIQQEKRYFFDGGSCQVNSVPSPQSWVPKNLVSQEFTRIFLQTILLLALDLRPFQNHFPSSKK